MTKVFWLVMSVLWLVAGCLGVWRFSNGFSEKVIEALMLYGAGFMTVLSLMIAMIHTGFEYMEEDEERDFVEEDDN